jgi:hypothetical protein
MRKRFIVATILALAACGKSNGDSGSLSYLAACAALEARTVALYSSCFHANPISAQWVNGASTCATTQKEIDKGLISYDATKGAACDVATRGLSCDFIYGPAAAPADCTAMLTGKVAANGTCYSSADCQAGFCTTEATATCPGTCKPFGTVDASCGDDAPCGPGLDCFGDVCKARSAAGGACPCQAGLWCDLEVTTSTGTGTCKAPLAAGATCNPHGSDNCALGFVCATDTATCQALVGEGGACAPPRQTDDSTVCGSGYHCDASTKKCVSDPAVGSACTTEINCLIGYCDDTTTPATPVCKALIASGGNCTTPEQCASLSCTDGTCDAPSGDICTNPF